MDEKDLNEIHNLMIKAASCKWYDIAADLKQIGFKLKKKIAERTTDEILDYILKTRTDE